MAEYIGIILAAGKGERLTALRHGQGRDSTLPKPLVYLNRSPIIDSNVLLSEVNGQLLISQLIIAAGNNAPSFEFWKKNHRFRQNIMIDNRQYPGSSAAAYYAMNLNQPQVGYLISSGDEVIPGFDLKTFLEDFKGSVFPALIGVAKLGNLSENRVFYTDSNKKVIQTDIKPVKYNQKDKMLVSLGILGIKKGFEGLIDISTGKNWYGLLKGFIAEGLLGVHIAKNAEYLNLNSPSDVLHAKSKNI